METFIFGAVIGFLLGATVVFVSFVIMESDKEKKRMQDLINRSSNPVAHYIGRNPDDKTETKKN